MNCCCGEVGKRILSDESVILMVTDRRSAGRKYSFLEFGRRGYWTSFDRLAAAPGFLI